MAAKGNTPASYYNVGLMLLLGSIHYASGLFDGLHELSSGIMGVVNPEAARIRLQKAELKNDQMINVLMRLHIQDLQQTQHHREQLAKLKQAQQNKTLQTDLLLNEVPNSTGNVDHDEPPKLMREGQQGRNNQRKRHRPAMRYKKKRPQQRRIQSDSFLDYDYGSADYEEPPRRRGRKRGRGKKRRRQQAVSNENRANKRQRQQAASNEDTTNKRQRQEPVSNEDLRTAEQQDRHWRQQRQKGRHLQELLHQEQEDEGSQQPLRKQ